MSDEIVIAREELELGRLPVEDAMELIRAGFLLPSDEWWTDHDATRKRLSELAPDDPEAAAGWSARARQLATGANEAVRRGMSKVGRALLGATTKSRSATKRASDLLLSGYIPRLQGFVRHLLAQEFAIKATSALNDEVFLRKLFGALYDCLPKPVLRFVDEPAFIAFCFERRRELLGEDVAKQPASLPGEPQ